MKILKEKHETKLLSHHVRNRSVCVSKLTEQPLLLGKNVIIGKFDNGYVNLTSLLGSVQLPVDMTEAGL